MQVLLAVFLLASVALGDDPRTFRSEFALAQQALEAKDHAAYLQHLEAAVLLDAAAGKGSFFQYHLARAFALNGRPADAIAALKTAWSADEGQMIVFADHDPAFAGLRGSAGYAAVRALFDSLQAEAIKAGGNVYEIRGAGCTLAASIGDDGILLVDSGYPRTSPAVARALKQISPSARVRYIVNTHGHYDHVGSNDGFGDVVIVAHPAALDEMKGGSDYVKPFGVPPIAAAGRADIVTDRRLTIPFNGEDVHVLAMPAHTPGDLVVWFERSKVLHMGDDYFGDDSAYLDPGASPGAFFTAMRELMATVPDDAVVLSGHASRVPASRLKATLASSQALYDLVKNGLASNVPVDAIVDDAVAKGHPRRWASAYLRRLSGT